MVNQTAVIITQEEALNTVKYFISRVRGMGINIKRAFLFGSFARNNQHEWSDIDVALVADNFIGLSVVDADPFLKLNVLPEFSSIEVHTFPTTSLTDGDAFLNEVVLRTGIEIN